MSYFIALDHLGVIAAAFTGWFVYLRRTKTPNVLILAIAVTVSEIFNVAIIIPWFQNRNNLGWFHLYTPIEFVLLAFFLYNMTFGVPTVTKRWAFGGVGALFFCLIAFYKISGLESFQKFDSFSATTESVILFIGAVIAGLWLPYRSPQTPLRFRGEAWALLAIAFYALFMITLFSAENRLVAFGVNVWQVQSVVSIIKHSLFIWGFVVYGRQ